MSAADRAGRAPKNHILVHPWLSVDGVAALEAEAARRGTHPDRLAAVLLELITRENLFAALLD